MHPWKVFLITSTITFLAGCGEPPLAGDMTAKDICTAAGTRIQDRLNDSVVTDEATCNVHKVHGNYVQIYSGYIDDGGMDYRYTARAVVTGDSLRLYEIRVDGIDDIFIPFNRFPDRF